MQHYAKVYCDTIEIPKYLEISVAAGEKNHVYRFGDVALPEGMRWPARTKLDAPVAVIQTK